ncbi:MAG: hypothetical protein Q9191_003898 [Dirinaria sp. TL-2023a]
MGETGVGKSTFIRTATGPGFGDTYRRDASILAALDEVLAELFHDQDVRLAGVLLLHSLSDARMKNDALKNLIMVSELVGSNNLHRCCLVTTKMSLAPRPAEAIEDELRGKKTVEPGFWKPLIEKGAKMFRFEDSKDSALQIIKSLLDDSSVVLQLTNETQRERRNLGETAAGKVVNRDIIRAREETKRELGQLKKKHERAMARRDKALADYLEQAKDQARDNLSQLDHQETRLGTRVEARSWQKRRWMGRIFTVVGVTALVAASNGVLAPLAPSLYNTAESSISKWR